MAEKTKTEHTATGRRKTSVASVRLAEGNGSIKVNGRPVEEYFTLITNRNFIQQPLQATNTEGKFDISARIVGGGTTGQASALRHAISRALVKSDAALREVLKESGFLTRDPRERERKKPGQPGARKRFQFSKR